MSRFAIRRVVTGPPELRAQLPVTGQAVATRTDPRGVRDFVYAILDKPVKYRFPARFDADPFRAEDLGSDEQGAFLWVSAVTFRAHGNRENPHNGMRDFAVDLAYVVDPTIDQDERLELHKIAPVAVVEIDDAGNAASPSVTDETTVVAARGVTGPPPQVPAHAFRHDLEMTVAALASLAGEPAEDVVIPPRIETADEPLDDRAGYLLGSDALRYHGWDPTKGWVWRETADPQELTYWIVDDIAATLAWGWAQKQPTFADMTEEQAVNELWMPRWQYLMTTLRPEWGQRTATTIAPLTQGNSGRPWDEIFDYVFGAPEAATISAAVPVVAPSAEPVDHEPAVSQPKRDAPWSATAFTGPPPQTFLADEEPWYRTKKIKTTLLFAAGGAVIIAASLLLVRGTGSEPINDETPVVATTPASSELASSSAATSSSSAARTTSPSPSPSPSAVPPPPPPPPPTEAQQITPQPTYTYRPTYTQRTRTPEPSSGESTETRSTRPPPPTLYTPPVQADPWHP